MTDPFIKFPKTLMQSSHWVSLTTGELIVLTPMQKIIWLHIKDRHDFFASKNQTWHENQQTIADTLNCDRCTVSDFLKALEHHGYLKTTKRIVQGCIQSNAYGIVQELQLAHVPRGGRIKAVRPHAAEVVPVMAVDAGQYGDDQYDDPFANVSVIPTGSKPAHDGNSPMHV